MTRIVITIEDNDRRVPQSPDDACDDRRVDSPKGSQAGKQVPSPTELFAKGENHVEDNSQGKGKSYRNQDTGQSQLLSAGARGEFLATSGQRVCNGTS